MTRATVWSKCKEKGEIGGLVSALKADNFQTRVEAIEALMDLGERRAIELVIKEFTNVLRFGDEADKIEGITIIQGRACRTSLIAVVYSLELPSDRWEKVWKLEKVRFRRKLGLHLARPILFETAENSDENPVIRWYALIALVELGDRSNEVMQLLINVLDTMPKMNVDTIEESLRALSCCSINPDIIAMLIETAKGQRFKAVLDIVPRSAAIYALGATGDPLAREYLEYLATHGDKFYRERARVALKLFGKASYDEINAKAEPK